MTRSLTAPVALLTALTLLVPAALAADDLSRHPGYVDGSALLGFADEDGELVEINVHGVLLRMLSEMVGGPESDVGRLFSRLKGVRALVIGLRDGDAEKARKTIHKMIDRLDRQGWETIAKIRDHGSTVSVLVRNTEEEIEGVTVFVLDDNQLVFTNIVGLVHLEDLRMIAEQLDIPGLGDLDGKQGTKGE